MAKKSKKNPTHVGFFYKIVQRKNSRGVKYYVRTDDGKRMKRDDYTAFRKTVKEYKMVYKLKDNRQAEKALLKADREEQKHYEKTFEAEIGIVINQGIYTFLLNLSNGINQFKQKFKFQIYYTKFVTATYDQIERAVDSVLKIFYSAIKRNKDLTPHVVWAVFRKTKTIAVLDLNQCYATLNEEEMFFNQIITAFKNEFGAI